jgi:hypothetical protein
VLPAQEAAQESASNVVNTLNNLSTDPVAPAGLELVAIAPAEQGGTSGDDDETARKDTENRQEGQSDNGEVIDEKANKNYCN